MAAENFFNRLTDEVLQATEHLSARMEEGISVLMSGGLPKEGGAQQEAQQVPPNTMDFEDIDFDSLSEEEVKRLLQEEMMQHSPLEGIADSVLGDIVGGSVGPQTAMENFHAFRSAITWSESFILSLVAFQIFMFFLCLWISRKDRGLTPRVCVLVFIGVVVRSAEFLNGIGARNWQSFSKQNYFDRKGVFVGIMLCGPLLVDCLMMLMLFVREAAQLLVLVKTTELKKKMGKNKKGDERVKSGKKGRAKTTKKQD